MNIRLIWSRLVIILLISMIFIIKNIAEVATPEQHPLMPSGPPRSCGL